MVNKIKLFLTDLDGVLTDGGMYYLENGKELRKFNTKDGMGFQLLREYGIKTGIISSEVSSITEYRSKQLKIDFLSMGNSGNGKLEYAKKIADEMEIDFNQIAYIGDDINCIELLEEVNISACPADANHKVQNIRNIKILKSKGGDGAVREFIDFLEINNFL